MENDNILNKLHKNDECIRTIKSKYEIFKKELLANNPTQRDRKMIEVYDKFFALEKCFLHIGRELSIDVLINIGYEVEEAKKMYGQVISEMMSSDYTLTVEE